MISAIQKYPVPKDVSALRRFLGLTSYFRKFIQDYATVCEPLYNLLKKDVIYEFDETCMSSFRNLKSQLTSDAVLTSPDFSKPFKLYTDASGVALGAMACLILPLKNCW